MEKHQIIFEKIKSILENHLEKRLIIYEDGTYLAIDDSEVWISCTISEIIVGFGLVHDHYYPEIDDLNQAIERFFNLLTRRIKTTGFFKGKFPYKVKTEIIIDESNTEKIGTAMTWLFPFWKRTIIKVSYQEALISELEIRDEFEKIKN